MPTDGVYEFVYPTVVGPRYSEKRESQASPEDAFVKAPYTHEGEAPRSDFHLAGSLSTGVPIQEITSPSHQRDVPPHSARGARRWRSPTSERFSGNRDFILRYRLAGETISSGLLLYQGRDENFFLLMAEPPQAVAADEVPPREYIFVVDVSGSMNGFPLDTGKKLMGDLVNVLRPSDTFNVVVFADGTETFSPARCRRRVPISRARCSSSARRTVAAAPASGGAAAGGCAPASDRRVAQHRAVHRWLHRRGSGRVRLRPQVSSTTPTSSRSASAAA